MAYSAFVESLRRLRKAGKAAGSDEKLDQFLREGKISQTDYDYIKEVPFGGK